MQPHIMHLKRDGLVEKMTGEDESFTAKPFMYIFKAGGRLGNNIYSCYCTSIRQLNMQALAYSYKAKTFEWSWTSIHISTFLATLNF